MERSDYCIYTLSDPRDRQMRYVGQSCNPENRLMAHMTINSYDGTPEKREWLREIKALRLKAIMDVIETGLTLAQAREREKYWILYYRERGHVLYNWKGPEKIQPEQVINLLRGYDNLLTEYKNQEHGLWDEEKERTQAYIQELLIELDKNYKLRRFTRYRSGDPQEMYPNAAYLDALHLSIAHENVQLKEENSLLQAKYDRLQWEMQDAIDKAGDARVNSLVKDYEELIVKFQRDARSLRRRASELNQETSTSESA